VNPVSPLSDKELGEPLCQGSTPAQHYGSRSRSSHPASVLTGSSRWPLGLERLFTGLIAFGFVAYIVFIEGVGPNNRGFVGLLAAIGIVVWLVGRTILYALAGK
jgi:hypothetical protein